MTYEAGLVPAAGRAKGDSNYLLVESSGGDAAAGESRHDPPPPKSKSSVQSSTLQKLGPAVHPSECALRSISPVTTGPIRNKPLKIENDSPILGEMAEMHELIMKDKMKAVVLSLESGRSRFGEEPLLVQEDLEEDQLFYACSLLEDDSFAKMILVLYSQNGYPCDPTDASALDDSADSIEAMNPKPLFIRHEPPDLTTIYRFKSLRAENNSTSYAVSLGTMFRPELKSLSGDTPRSSIRRRKKREACSSGKEDGFSSRPKFNVSSYWSGKSNAIDFSSREALVPFTNFFQHIRQKDNSPNNSPSTEQPSTICNALSAMDEIGSFIRLDPDIPMIEQKSDEAAKTEPGYAALNKSLDDLCSASSVAKRLNLPPRFEMGHGFDGDDSRSLITICGTRFNFLEKVMEQYKATLSECPSSFESCLRFIESRDVAGSRDVIPRKISLDSSICLFDESTNDEESEGPTATTNEMVARLPSFSSLLAFSPAFREKGVAIQKRHVTSSARVSDARALKNVIDSGRAPCLFLPQIDVKSRAEPASSSDRKRNRMERDPITHIVRSCVPSDNLRRAAKFLKEQKSNYPVKHWFSADGTGCIPSHHVTTDPDKWTDLQKETSKKKRREFCRTAQAINHKENYRTVLNTGCSSRRNVRGAYSYRGLLTNQLVAPRVFERRYLSMLGMQKACRLNAQTTFAAMSQDILVAALLRRKNESGKQEENKRAAPLISRLKTKRHDSLELVQEQKRTSNLFEAHSAGLSKIPCIDNLASQARRYMGILSQSTLPDNIIKELGEILKGERGELLHLVSKADELEKEERGYIEELRVLNGHAKSTNHDLFDDLCDMTLEPDVCKDVTDVLAKQPDSFECIGKKLEVVELPLKRNDLPDECIAEKRREKKKRKKDKRKNETSEERAERKAAKKDETPEERAARKAAKRKKKKDKKVHRKRKSKLHSSADDLAGVAKKTKVVGRSDGSNSQDSSALATVRRNVKMAVPSLELGITPILPPKAKTKNQPGAESIKTVQKPDVNRNKRGSSVSASHKIKDSTLLSISKSNSPDSVASLNEGRKLFTSGKKSFVDDNRLRTPRELEDELDDSDLSLEKELNDSDLFGSNGVNEAFDDESKPSLCKHVDPLFENLPLSLHKHSSNESDRDILEFLNCNGSHESHPIRTEMTTHDNQGNENQCIMGDLTLLSSESFLETFTETVASLASGRWISALSPDEKNQANALTNKNIMVCDCPLVDLCGVDIELNGQGVIVAQLSSWLENDQCTQKGSREFIRRLVLLAASGRYSSLHVILCVNIEITKMSNEIVTLQNALVQQTGCYCEQVTFEFVTPRVLPASLALRLLSTPSNGSDIGDFVCDENTLERARFLIMLVPTMTIHMAQKCLGYSEDQDAPTHSGEALYNLFRLARSMGREEFVTGSSSMLSELAAHQLWLALHVEISHAH